MISISRKTGLYAIVVMVSVTFAIYIAKPEHRSEVTKPLLQNQSQQLESVGEQWLGSEEVSDPGPMINTNQPIEHLSAPVDDHPDESARYNEAQTIAIDNISHANIALGRLGDNLQDNEDQVLSFGGYIDEQNQIHIPETAAEDVKIKLEHLTVEREGIIAEMAQYRINASESEKVLGVTE